MAERDEIQLAADAVVFQARKKIGTLYERIEMLSQQVAHLTEQRDGLQDSINRAPDNLSRMQRALKWYVDQHGGLHDDDCPEDDTCQCLFVKETNELCEMATF